MTRGPSDSTKAIIVFGLGYLLGTAINDRPIRLVRHATRRARVNASSAVRSAARLVPWVRSNGHGIVDVREVGEVMTPIGATIGPKTTLRDAAAAIERAGLDEILVVKKRRPRGILTAREVNAAIGRGADPVATRVSDVLDSGVVTISGSSTVHEANEMMRRSGSSRLVVVDGDGQPIGTVTAVDRSPGDVVRSILRLARASA